MAVPYLGAVRPMMPASFMIRVSAPSRRISSTLPSPCALGQQVTAFVPVWTASFPFLYYAIRASLYALLVLLFSGFFHDYHFLGSLLYGRWLLTRRLHK